MKRLHIRTGITCILAFLFLLGIIAIGKGSGAVNFFRNAQMADAQMQENKYTYRCKTENLKELHVSWVSGSVHVRLTDSDKKEVQITEYSNGKLEKTEQLALEYSRGILQIKWKDEFVSLSWLNRLEKNLFIEIPKELVTQMKEINCDTASGDITVDGFQTKSMNLSSAAGDITTKGSGGERFSVSCVSGEMNMENVACDSLNVSTNTGNIYTRGIQAKALSYSSISGSVEISGIFSETLRGDAISAKAVITCEKLPENMALESVSGSIHIHLPADSKGFRVENETISGDLFCDFPFKDDVQDKTQKVCGDGSADFKISTTSASVYIRKAA